MPFGTKIAKSAYCLLNLSAIYKYFNCKTMDVIFRVKEALQMLFKFLSLLR